MTSNTWCSYETCKMLYQINEYELIYQMIVELFQFKNYVTHEKIKQRQEKYDSFVKLYVCQDLIVQWQDSLAMEGD